VPIRLACIFFEHSRSKILNDLIFNFLIDEREAFDFFSLLAGLCLLGDAGPSVSASGRA
jgi:hypothetical protein